MDLKISQNEPFTLAEQDKAGNPVVGAPFDSAPAWGIKDPSFGEVQVSEDGLSALVVPNGKLGQSQLQVSASIAGKTYAGSLDLNFLPGDVTQIGIVPGTPVDQQDAPPADGSGTSPAPQA